MKKRIAAVAIMCLFLLGAVGCSKNTESKQPKEKKTRVVQDSNGDVNIPINPNRIVDLSGNSDTLAILGYNVVGTCNSDAYDDTKFPSYLEKTLEGAQILGYSMSDTVDLEAVIALEPDFIIISKTQQKSYDQLKEIAPTVMITASQMDWKEDFMTIANIMDKEETAKKWLTKYEEKAKTVGENIKKEVGEDATYLSVLASYGSIYAFDGAGLGSFMYEDLGLKRPDNLPKQENVSLPLVTKEGLAQINADYLIAVGTDKDFQELDKSGIFNNLKPVKNGKFGKLPASPYFNQGYSPLGRLLLLDEVQVFVNEHK